MSTAQHKKIEVVGTSGESLVGAIRNGVKHAGETPGSLKWFEVTEIRGRIDGDSVDEYQVTLKVGVRVD